MGQEWAHATHRDPPANRAASAGLGEAVRFEQGDSQRLPFPDASFDAVINECAVGIPEDSQAVVDEMVRVVRPGGIVVIHESTWRRPLADAEKHELSERYGTTPLDPDEWVAMLASAGLREVRTELEPWSMDCSTPDDPSGKVSAARIHGLDWRRTFQNARKNVA